MAELFKNIYNKQFFTDFANQLKVVAPKFDNEGFIKDIFDAHWEEKELKQRMRHTSEVLNKHLSNNFKQNAENIVRFIQYLQKTGLKEHTIEYMFIPDFIEVYGVDDYETSIKAFEKITQFTSCEFAVRPFIIKYENMMMQQMLLWSDHENDMVRRLASEGCRPRLPWAMALPELKRNPKAILPILERLKNDASESVRRSVANNLNDISKDNPEIVITLAKQWIGKSKETDWVVKHACRTLLKQGHPKVMPLFGFGDIKHIKVSSFEVHTPTVNIGNYLEFSFNLENSGTKASLVRLEYGLYYQKQNGTLSRKVFKISEKLYPKDSITNIVRKQSFKIITTRKYHTGLHQVSLIINGKELEKLDFEVIIGN